MKEIILQNAALGYGKKTVLSDINLVVKEGDVCLIKGPNGSGKTTLGLGLLGILQLQGGRRTSSFLRPAYVPQTSRFDLQYPITIAELVSMGLPEYSAIFSSLNKTKKCAIFTKTREVLVRVGLAEKGKKLFHQVSGGEFQRALIARALISNPDVMLLDEPFSNIDKAGKRHIKDLLLSECARLGCTLIIIDHHENVDFCTNCFEIENNTVITYGTA